MINIHILNSHEEYHKTPHKTILMADYVAYRTEGLNYHIVKSREGKSNIIVNDAQITLDVMKILINRL
jgi:hypothetical protein